jgi:hypothetical protein
VRLLFAKRRDFSNCRATAAIRNPILSAISEALREIVFRFSPHLSRGFPGTLEALQPEKTWVVCPMTGPGYNLRPGVRIVGIEECLKELEGYK